LWLCELVAELLRISYKFIVALNLTVYNILLIPKLQDNVSKDKYNDKSAFLKMIDFK